MLEATLERHPDIVDLHTTLGNLWIATGRHQVRHGEPAVDAFRAALASFDAGTSPNIVQNFDLAAQTMFDTGKLVPAHTLMDAGEADKVIRVGITDEKRG